jgi:hypothetical protein
MNAPNTVAVAKVSMIAVPREVTFALSDHTGLAASDPRAKPVTPAARTTVFGPSLQVAHQLGKKRSDGPMDKTRASIAGRMKTNLVTEDGGPWAFEDAGFDGMVLVATTKVGG